MQRMIQLKVCCDWREEPAWVQDCRCTAYYMREILPLTHESSRRRFFLVRPVDVHWLVSRNVITVCVSENGLGNRVNIGVLQLKVGFIVLN